MHLQERLQVQLENFSEIKKIELWENQREPNQNTIDSITNIQCEYFKEYKRFDFPGAIVIANLKGNAYYLIDGQHRLKAAEKLLVLYPAVKDILLPVHTYLCDTKKHVDKLYCMLNTSNTNNCMVSNGQVSNFGISLKKIHTLLIEEYGPFIWDSKRINYPHVNLNILDSEINKSCWLDTNSEEEIISAIKRKNKKCVREIKKDKELYEKLKLSNTTRSKDHQEFLLHHKSSKAKWIGTLF